MELSLRYNLSHKDYEPAHGIIAYGSNPKQQHSISAQGPLLLTWFNFNPSMDK